MSRKQSVECYMCGLVELKRDCRARLPVPRKTTKQRPHRYRKGAGTLGNGFSGKNKTASEVKIRGFTRGSGSTIPGKIYENSAAITIDTDAEVFVRKGLTRAKDVEPIPETIRLKTVTGKSTPIMGEASVEICIGQPRIRHCDLMEETSFWDPVREVLRLGNEEFKLNQRCIEAKPAKLIAYHNCKHCDRLSSPKHC